MIQKRFECPVCQEAFVYEPSKKIKSDLRATELSTGSPIIVLVECPHCPANLYLDLISGQANVGWSVDEIKRKHTLETVVWDMTVTEEIKDRVEKLNKEGDRLMASGKIKDAQKKFEKAIKTRRHDPLSWYNLGVAWFQQDDVGGAESAFRHATEHDESFVKAWNNLGMLLLHHKGDINEAMRCFSKGISADPEYPKCYLGMGSAYMMAGEFQEARRYYNLALEKDPKYTAAKEALRRIDLFERSQR